MTSPAELRRLVVLHFEDLWEATDDPGQGREGCLEYASLINIRPAAGNRTLAGKLFGPEDAGRLGNVCERVPRLTDPPRPARLRAREDHGGPPLVVAVGFAQPARAQRPRRASKRWLPRRGAKEGSTESQPGER